MQFENLMIADNGKVKICKSSDYNYIFNKETGFFARWGKNKEDDPQWGPAPEILDLEISTSPKCSGRCKFCYKKNAPGQEEHNLTFDEFVTIFDKMPKTLTQIAKITLENGEIIELHEQQLVMTQDGPKKVAEMKIAKIEREARSIPILTQIAFGICDVDTNPDFFRMMEYARENGVVPNYTCNGHKITPEIAQKTAELCGAVAVSLVTKEKSYDAIKMFTDAGMNQCNIHYMLSNETYDEAFAVIDEIASDPRLAKLNAIVFLQYKPKNREANYTSCVNIDKYQKLIAHCTDRGVNYGFDSCSANVFMKSIEGSADEERAKLMAEPCESGLFSSYINCYGEFVYCSFAEGIEKHINVFECEDFLRDVWHSDQLKEWRNRLLDNNRECPIYDLSVKS